MERVRSLHRFRHAAEAAEEDREGEGGRQRLNDGPRRAEDRLLVADLDVAPDEKEEQLAVRPELRQIQHLQGAGSLEPECAPNRVGHRSRPFYASRRGAPASDRSPRRAAPARGTRAQPPPPAW